MQIRIVKYLLNNPISLSAGEFTRRGFAEAELDSAERGRIRACLNVSKEMIIEKKDLTVVYNGKRSI